MFIKFTATVMSTVLLRSGAGACIMCIQCMCIFDFRLNFLTQVDSQFPSSSSPNIHELGLGNKGN